MQVNTILVIKMPKIAGGGNKRKNQARKHLAPNRDTRIRLAHEDGEVYGVATKMLGNGMFGALRMSGKNTGSACVCVIRNAFKGRHKRGNMVNVGTVVLLGEREWTSADSKTHMCDLLEVYSDSEKTRLCADNIISTETVLAAQPGYVLSGVGDYSGGFQFANQEQIDASEFLSNEVNVGLSAVMSESDINISDI